MTRKFQTINDVPARLIDVWEQAFESGLHRLELENESKARSMQARLYSVRKTMRREAPEFYDKLKDLEVTLSGRVVTIQLSSWLKPLNESLNAVGKAEVPEYVPQAYPTAKPPNDLSLPDKVLSDFGYVNTTPGVNLSAPEAPIDPRELLKEDQK